MELGALRLLEKQLDRCGPEHLAGVAVETGPSWWGLGGVFAVGLLLGAALAQCGRSVAGLLIASLRAPAAPTQGRPSLAVAVTPKTKVAP